MIRCNGFCSGGRAIPARRTLDTGAAHSAGRRRRCCAAFANMPERSTSKLSADFGRSPIGTTTGAAEMTARTWTFLERTKIGLKRRQNP